MYNQKEFMSDLEMRNTGEPEFIQAVSEVLESVIDIVNNDPEYMGAKILERIGVTAETQAIFTIWEKEAGFNEMIQDD